MNQEQFEPKLEKYSFCLFRIPENGGRVLWEITNSCNYGCGYCIFSSENKKIPEELSTEEVYEALSGLRSRNFTHIKYTGGEPFTRNDFMDILAKSSGLGFVIDISTNGSLITKEHAKMIKEYGIQMVHVSVDGHTQEIHEAARGKNTYLRTMTGIQLLTDNDVYVRIGTVIFKENENYLEEIIQSAAGMEVNELIFSFMEPVGRMKENPSQISSRPITEVRTEIKELAQKYSKKIKVSYSFSEDVISNEDGICPGVNRFLYIDNLGMVSPCTWAVDQNPEFRSKLNLKNASFDEIMSSEPIKSYLVKIDSLKQKGAKGCPARKRC